MFFAAINVGFKPSHSTQLNKIIWIDAYLDYVKHKDDLSLNGTEPGLNISVNTETSSGKNFSIQISPPDSIEEKKEGNEFISDSTKIVDSLMSAVDTVKVDSMALDSTARLEQFRYQRSEDPVVSLKKKRRYSFFAEPSDNMRVRSIKIDSTGQFVEITEKVGGQETKVLLKLPIEEYIKLRLALKERESWESLGYAYELKSQVKGLGDLIKDITDFEIPLPSVGLLSIFGTPKISLKIGGAVDIHGAWRSETTEGVTASRLGNTRNEPDFKQQVQINVNGTIGDKLNISADWNTERTFEYENQLKLKYTGYEDEIIQSIEAGNVSLQTSPLVGGSEALFGIKANFKMGPLTLTTIASQKKGEVKEVSVSGGSTTAEYGIRVTEYSKNHYFVDSIYADTSADRNYFNKYYANPTPIVDQTVRIQDIEVWKSTTTSVINKANERNANAFISLPPLLSGQVQYPDNPYRQDLTNPEPGSQETARFIKLELGVDYKLQPETGYITFLTQIQEQDIIAVAYRTPTERFGEFINTAADDSQKLVLKLIKPKNLLPQYTTAWSLQLKNIYPLNARNLKKDGFEFYIKFEVEGQEPVTNLGNVALLNAFGLDVIDASGQGNPDNIFDWRPDVTILPATGEIIFPTLQPFGLNLPVALDTALRYQAVYTSLPTIARQDKAKDKWVLAGKSSGDASSVYQLGFNIVENSVRVRLNGRELSPGSDYSVDYNTGQLTLRNSEATLPGADLKITFEQNDLFQLASKTLLGARGIFDFSKKTKLGFSILNLNQQTLSDKVRIGEEPLSNTIYGLDFETAADLPFVTKGLDNIISTREMSSFSIKGEYAYINPDPNTKKSTIASDQGKSIAYIDDFEGAKRIIPVGVAYTAWRDLSPPGRLNLLEGLSSVELMDYKAKSFWFTETPSNVIVSDLYGDRKKVAAADQQITVMDYVFLPDTPGTYNYYQGGISPRKDSTWGGIMKPLSSTATNLIEENVEFIEFWLQIRDAPADGKLYIDLGRITEDVIQNGNTVIDKEDKDDNGAITNEAEDTGIDGLSDAEERARYNSTKADPSGDNFFFQRGSQTNAVFDYFNINGTQGNAILTDIGRIPDTEDLNRNSTLDVVNSYFRYAIPLDTVQANNPYIVGGGEKLVEQPSWYLYRIPLKDTVALVGNPDLSNVETIRLFLHGLSDAVHLRITEFNLVGSQWQKLVKEDSVLSISVINKEDNPDYTSPPGVFPERDRSKPDEEVYANEQALNLIITDLEQGQKREAVKYLFRPLDVFNYSEMKLFIHGDKQGNSISDTTLAGKYRAEVYFRFGGDTNNYYEYRQPVRPDWNEISILFSELTAIKQARDSSNAVISIDVEGKPGHSYRVLGNPTLTSIKYLTVGIVNISDSSSPDPISGEVWVNELRVIGADDTPGFAYSVSTSFKMADLLTVGFNMSQTDPYFHRLADRFGTRVESKNWSVNTDLNVLKLLPINLPESNLRINYSHTESVGKPLYIPGTDIKVDAAAEQLRNRSDTLLTTKTPENLIAETQTINISDTWSASNIKLKIPSNYWLIRDTWNAISLGFNYNKTFARNPTTESSKTWVWNATANYGLSLSPTYHFEPIDIPILGTPFALLTDYSGLKVYYLPQSFNLAINAKRNRNTNTTRGTQIGGSQTTISRDFTTSRTFSFAWKMTEGGFLNLTTNYNLTVNSTLAYLETDASGQQRSEGDIWRDIFTRVFFGQDFQYQQSLDFKTAPKLPTLWDLNKFFSITAGYSASYQWSFDTRQEDLGRSAGFSNRSNVGLTLRLKSLSAPLFEESKTDVNKVPPPKNQTQNPPTNRRGRDRIIDPNIMQGGDLGKIDSVIVSDSLKTLTDSLMVEEIAELDTVPKVSPITNALNFLKTFARIVLFDYETISVNFTNDNSLSKSGIYGKGTGFSNFWGIAYDENNGPTRGFMIGLSNDVGRRAGNANLTDAFQQKNNLDFRTSRPLWEGAKIDLTWKVGWSMNKSTTLTSDQDGNVTINFITSTGTINRSFLSLPPSLFLSVFNSGIKRVNELYNPSAPNPSENLSNAFIEGFESLPLLSKLGFLNDVAKYIPRPNWRITWDGLEKVFIFKSIAKRVSLDHSYSSSYTEGWKINPEGAKEVQSQKIEYGFTPLVGLNITFGELWGGNLTSNIKYSARTNYDLGITTKNITETFSRDIGITAGYSKQGFELPLFGVALKNDIEFSLSYTSTKNSTVRFEMQNFSEEGTPQDGTIRTTIEPRIKYTISSKVTISIFYKRSSVEPEGAARIPPTTTNEAGLDVHIAISN